MSRPLPASNGGTRWDPSGNAALWYEKLGGDWNTGWSLKADAKGGNKKLDWIRSVAGKLDGEGKPEKILIGDEMLLAEHAERQRRLSEAGGGRTLALKNRSTFVSGLGEGHPIETGFAWHPVLGVPYLPGSGIKGALKSWLASEGPKDLIDLAAHLDDGEDALPEGLDQPDEEEIMRLFGGGGIGAIDFLPLLPVEPVRLQADLVNPHHVPYQRGQEWPADWQNPVPSFFLAVAPSQRWQLGIVPRDGLTDSATVERVIGFLLQAGDWLGLGAKTAVGYGRFKPDQPSGSGKSKKGKKA